MRVARKVIAEPYHPEEEEDDSSGKIATFEDPDGNYFQLMSSMGGEMADDKN